MIKNRHIIDEKKIYIPKSNTLNNIITAPKSEYRLNKNFFDPTKSSPPNEFMLKLYMRDQAYNLSYKKDDNLEIQ